MSEESNDNQIQNVCLMILTGFVVMYALYWLRPVLVPFVVALFVVSGIAPILSYLESRLGVSRLIAAAITFMLGLLITLGLGFCLWLSVLQMAEEGEAYRARVSEIIEKVETWLQPAAVKTADEEDRNNDDSEADGNENEKSTEDVEKENSPELQNSELTEGPSFGGMQITTSERFQNLKELVDSAIQSSLTYLSGELIQLASTVTVVLIYVFFLLLGKEDIKDSNPTLAKIDHQVRSYLMMKTVISIVTGMAFGLALALFGVPMALTFGMLAFLLNFIPNVGPIIACLLPVPFILLSPDGSLLWMISAISVTSAIQLVSGNVVEPQLMGDSAGLHPIVILLGLMLWGMLWGITGMFLATPVTAAVKIILERLEPTRKFANMMGETPLEHYGDEKVDS